MNLIPKLTFKSFFRSLDTRDILIKYFVIILLGVVIFYFDELEIVDPWLNTIFILVLSLGKTLFFVLQSLKKISEVINKYVAYFRFLLFMTMNVFIIIVSFGIDFFCLYWVDETHYSGLPVGMGPMRMFFECIYLSMLAFNNLGFYDIVPVSIACKVLVMVEIMIYYFSIILILSDFISLRDSILEDRMRNKT